MKKILFLLFTLNVFATLLYAQDEKLLNSLKKINTLKAQFSQVTSIAGVGEDKYEGTLYMVKGEKILWDYNKPHRQFYLFTKDELSTYDSMTKQLVKQKAENLGVENIVFRILMEPSDIKNTFFVVVMNNDQYKLYPKEDIGLQYLEITLKDNIIKKIISKDEQGNSTEINLNDVQINRGIDKSVFNVKVPEGTEVFTY
jgi:outer membrane lipoprotein carrier protein